MILRSVFPYFIHLISYEVGVTNDVLQVKILRPYSMDIVPILEKFSCSIHLESCAISDEPILKAFDVSEPLEKASLPIHCDDAEIFLKLLLMRLNENP